MKLYTSNEVFFSVMALLALSFIALSPEIGLARSSELGWRGNASNESTPRGARPTTMHESCFRVARQKNEVPPHALDVNECNKHTSDCLKTVGFRARMGREIPSRLTCGGMEKTVWIPTWQACMNSFGCYAPGIDTIRCSMNCTMAL